MNDVNCTYHIPVLLKESVDGLNIDPSGTYVDVTFGGGGHSREILRRLGPNGRLIAFDQDEQAYANRPDDDRLIFVRHNFRYIAQFLRYLDIDKVDGILGDLGVSSHHFDAPERGFSFRFDAPLDMRMGQGMTTTAADIVNNYQERDLARVLSDYGEIDKAMKLAKVICAKRSIKPIKTTFELKEIVAATVIPPEQNKLLTKVFQALRIEVNGEMDALKEMLSRTPGLLREGGRLVIIAYHSLEDRMVKNIIKSGDVSKAAPERDDIYGHVDVPFEAVSRKVIVPSDEEIERNSRARSAKLRIAEKIGE
ncbi:MAG: 16S rRNA (cytosine(1402)-N(4))-methyltransferase RsmH [Bacteroidales bacterium]|nr:16S rRNA (cytosine(1402)-N(4))-methyltransferase RsmH [Bacteroidales bacterium]